MVVFPFLLLFFTNKRNLSQKTKLWLYSKEISLSCIGGGTHNHRRKYRSGNRTQALFKRSKFWMVGGRSTQSWEVICVLIPRYCWYSLPTSQIQIQKQNSASIQKKSVYHGWWRNTQPSEEI